MRPSPGRNPAVHTNYGPQRVVSRLGRLQEQQVGNAQSCVMADHAEEPVPPLPAAVEPTWPEYSSQEFVMNVRHRR